MNEIQPVLEKTVAALSVVSGIQAIVLGGSRVRGNHTSSSDIDIGIYYESECNTSQLCRKEVHYDADTLDLAGLNEAARMVDDTHRESLIATPGEWGIGVNGGGWLTIDGYPVDFILRDTSRVEKSIADGRKGVVTSHYQPGHPHAFINTIYMGELAICKLLWENDDRISVLKESAEQYPDELKKALIYSFSFEAGFSLLLAEKSFVKNDMYYIIAHIVRSVSALNQVIFALNREYCLNEKNAVQLIESFSIHPAGYESRVKGVFSAIGTNPEKACMQLGCLIDEVTTLLK